MKYVGFVELFNVMSIMLSLTFAFLQTLAKVVEGWKQRESQKNELIDTLQQENAQLRATQDHQQQVGYLTRFSKRTHSSVQH